MPWVHILRCSDDTLYVGVTTNLDLRLDQHAAGEGGPYTSKRRPVKLAYSEEPPKMVDAITRERQLKQWSGQKKQVLI